MEEPFLAEVRFVPARVAPEGWAWCDGREMLISEYPALFELLGTTYGGDGQYTFALPNLSGRKPVQLASHVACITVSGQHSGPFGLSDHIQSQDQTQSYHRTRFCIALRGVLPMYSGKPC
ncbi:phage tail protein [Dyadobacter sandarakinus]|uniref:Tail fiber protein n=1 Tax=Dyadobacter sandarakinus TaxID=2747268 RepID=A0ABX7I3R0_9BACT|nr:tail fiber protein [Dyadobacter sandarakinus]QRR00202.1 tail fiber protein [Dyadobacter sandarakinus]